MRWWDLPAILTIEHELFGPTAWSEQTFWSELAAPGRCYLVGERPGPDGAPPELTGYAGLMHSAGQADVQTLAVAPAAQGAGWGARLLTALLEAAVHGRAGAVMLEVRADNAPAISLYRRFGFEQLAVRRRYYQPGDVDALVMRLRPVRLPVVPSRRD